VKFIELGGQGREGVDLRRDGLRTFRALGDGRFDTLQLQLRNGEHRSLTGAVGGSEVSLNEREIVLAAVRPHVAYAVAGRSFRRDLEIKLRDIRVPDANTPFAVMARSGGIDHFLGQAHPARRFILTIHSKTLLL